MTTSLFKDLCYQNAVENVNGITKETTLLGLSSLAEPGLGAPLSSYLEGALYNLIYR